MNVVSSDIIEKWLTAWSLSRNLPLPVPFRSGFKVDVGWENQKARYVFPALNEDFIQLAESTDEHSVYLKVCASPDELKKVISGKWTIQPQGYMMSCFHRMKFRDRKLPSGYRLCFDHYNSTHVIRITTQNNETAATGRVVMVDDLAVYDRILTDLPHQRKGLATILMKELESIAHSHRVFKNLLVATEEGKSLYNSIGWEIYSLYTSLVIPA